jgi:hypothetical protein
MKVLEFVIPLNPESLQKESNNSYYVEEVLQINDLSTQEAKTTLTGNSFTILFQDIGKSIKKNFLKTSEHFDTLYSFVR